MSAISFPDFSCQKSQFYQRVGGKDIACNNIKLITVISL